MADRIRLYSTDNRQQTAVSNIFIDNYMPQANGEYVKIYLQILRCIQHARPISSLTEIADLFDHTETDILRALKYWERQGLMSLEYDGGGSLEGICLLDPSVTETDRKPGESAAAVSSAAATVSAAASVSEAAVPAGSKAAMAAAVVPAAAKPLPTIPLPAEPIPREYSAEELNAFGENPELEELFFIIQTYMQHPLNEADTNLVLFWYDELGFSVELIEYLVEYCITKGHYSTSYMNKVALGWAKNQIHTVAEARENVQMHSQIYYAVIKALGIHGRSLVPTENEFIRKWTRDYGFSQELIEEACSRTISATHQPSFEYTDSILTRWNKEQVHTLQDVEKADELFNQQKKKPAADPRPLPQRSGSNKFNNFNQRSYNESELEKMLLNASLGNPSH